MGPPPEEFGPYTVYEQLGLGGMATVHRAETRGIAGFRRPVALKRMLPSAASDDSTVQAFIREARLASYLRHANVAQTYELGKVGDVYFIAMELVPGPTLRQVQRHCARYGIKMPLPIVLNILSQICEALDYAHNLTDESGQPLGIIHRDVSPSNIIVSDGGVVKLIDFGIAKASAVGMQTMSRTLKGKFSYMAPEYIAGSIDTRADLFAVGVIAHELLANEPLFYGKDDMDTLFRVKNLPVIPPSMLDPTIPIEIDAIIMTALQRDPNVRWQRASALRAALATETKRLGLAVLDTQVSEWVAAALKTEGRDSEPSIVIERGTEVLQPNRDPDAALEIAKTIMRPSNSVPVPRPSAPQPVQRPSPPPGPPSAPQAAQPEPRLTLLGAGAFGVSAATTDAQPSSGGAGVRREPAAFKSDAVTQVSSTFTRPRPRRWWIAVVLLVVAAGLAAVIYFGWPYLHEYLP